MRDFIINRFALDYICKFQGYNFDTPRALVAIGPSLLLLTFTITLHFHFKFLFWVDCLLISILAVKTFFALIYFKLYPIKPCELKDKEQVYQFEIAVKRKVVLPEIESEECLKKIFDANTFIIENVESKKSYKSYRIFYHPVLILLISGIVTLLYYYAIH